MPVLDSPPAPTPRHGLGPALLWACFLGCSWTWVIGMFLPIMLLRDFGVAGWVAFAVPNVVGAAAMGFVLRTPDISWKLARQHAGALRWFAGVTIAYQIYVVVWLFSFHWLWLALACVLPWLVMSRQHRERWDAWLPGVSVAVAVVSWGAFSLAGQLDGAWTDVAQNVEPSRLPPLDLWLLAPGLVAGFLLCPYLDPTFHRARYSTGPGTGRAAFALGFGVVFGSMIVFSLMYAGITRPLIDGQAGFALPSPWRAILTIHVGVQVAFTLLAHGRERFDDAARHDARWGSILTRGLVLVGFAGLLGLAAAGRFDFIANFIPGLTPGEVGYRLFLLAYGVFFPAYVLICIIPTFRSNIAPAAKRRVFLIASLAAYPPAVMGFIVGPAWWLIGLYAILALGRVAVELLPLESPPPPPAG